MRVRVGPVLKRVLCFGLLGTRPTLFLSLFLTVELTDRAHLSVTFGSEGRGDHGHQCDDDEHDEHNDDDSVSPEDLAHHLVIVTDKKVGVNESGLTFRWVAWHGKRTSLYVPSPPASPDLGSSASSVRCSSTRLSTPSRIR